VVGICTQRHQGDQLEHHCAVILVDFADERLLEGLEHVLREGEDDDGHLCGPQHHHVHPGAHKAWQRTPEGVQFAERFNEVRIFCPRTRHDSTQLGKGQSTWSESTEEVNVLNLEKI